jgi:hypothetical protein
MAGALASGPGLSARNAHSQTGAGSDQPENEPPPPTRQMAIRKQEKDRDKQNDVDVENLGQPGHPDRARWRRTRRRDRRRGCVFRRKHLCGEQ